MINPVKINRSILIITTIFAVSMIRIPGVLDTRAGMVFNAKCGIIFLFSIFLYSEDKLAGGLLFLSLFSHSIPWYVFSKYTQLTTLESESALYSIVLGCGFYLLLLKSNIETSMLLNLMCVIALINFAFLLCQVNGIDPYYIFFYKSNISPTGLMANRNEVSALFAICSVAFFRNRWCFFIPVIAVGIVFSESLNGMVGLCVGGMVYMSFENRWILFVGLIISIFIFCIDFNINSSSSEQRIYIWKKSIKIAFNNNPINGFGIGNWKNIDKIITNIGGYTSVTSWSRVHNSFIQGYIEMGIFFLALVAGFFARVIVYITKDQRLPISAMAAIFICMNTNSLFQMNIINGMFVIIWVSILTKQQKKREVCYG